MVWLNRLKPYLGPEVLSSKEGDWYTFEHSVEYRESQLRFLEILQQADGNRLYHVLENNPYHIDTLMQLSEMMVQQGDLGMFYFLNLFSYRIAKLIFIHLILL